MTLAYRVRSFCAFLIFSSLVLAGCGGGGGDDGVDDGGADDGTTTGTTTTGAMQVKLSGAVALLAQDQTVAEVAKAYQKTSASTGEPLFTYQIVNQGLTEEAAASLRKVRPVAGLDTTTSGGTNLLAIDADGNASLAIESDLPIKVMYSVTDPAGEHVYLALDTGWWSWDGNDYSQFIAKNNCAFYKVKIADNTFSCVKEGVFVQRMDDTYMQSVSGNQKPVQFDDDSNVYFSATTFLRECEEWDNNGDGTISDDERWCWVGDTSWNPRIYKMAVADGTVTALTQDNASVQFFLALSTGEIAYQSNNTQTWESSLYVWQNGQTINLTDNGWGISFFTQDTGNTVMWGDWETPGIRFGRPASGGGIYRATLNTTLFGDNSYGTTTPRRIISGDDGRLYGVFESWRSEADPDDVDGDGNTWEYYTVLSVYQILPYDAVPKIELTLDQSDSYGWWDWMGDTPFQISKGFLYYTETRNVEIDGASFGTADLIHMVRLEDRSTQTVLEAGLTDTAAARYEIYSWRLSGDELHFSALDKSRTVVVTGKIDTALVKQGASEAEYLSVTDSASAVGSTAKIQDIEVLKPRQPAEDTGMPPVVQQFHASDDNRYSLSVDFSKYMDKTSVEESLTLVESSSGGSVPAMKLWLYQTLHLVPDLSGLGDTTTTPLASGTSYTLTLEEGARDAWNWLLADGTQGKSVSWTTVPSSGWYTGDTSSFAAALSAGKALKYAGPQMDWDIESYNLGVNAAGNVRLEFSAKNIGWAGVNVVMWNQTKFDTDLANWGNAYAWDAMDANIRLEYWSSISYKSSATCDYTNNWCYSSVETPDVFNGTWKRYRIDVVGTTLKVYVSEDGVTFEESGLAVNDLRDRASTVAENQKLLLRVREPVMIDNLSVSSLDSNGNVTGSLLSEDFTAPAIDVAQPGLADGDGVGFDDDVELDTATYGDLSNQW